MSQMQHRPLLCGEATQNETNLFFPKPGNTAAKRTGSLLLPSFTLAKQNKLDYAKTGQQ
jgi:hypothetical protein